MNNLLINYIIVFLCGLFVWFYFLKSLLIAFVQVKFSGGSKILVHIGNSMADYYSVGKYDRGAIYFKARAREDNPNPSRMLYIGKKGTEEFDKAVYTNFGVPCIDVSDEKDTLWVRYNDSYKSINPFNAEFYDEMQKTALAKPSLKKGLFDEKTRDMIMIFSFILILGGLFLVYKKMGTLDEHIKLVYDLLTTMAPKV